jgi:DnaJ domain
MTVREALEILGVGPDAAKEEIEAAFRKAARTAHPDSENGNRPLWDRLVEARDLLIGPSESRTLVPLDAVREMARAQERALVRADERAERVAATEITVRSVVMRHTAPLERQRRVAWAAGLFAGGIGVLLTLLRSVDLRPEGEAGSALVTVMILLYVTSGLLGLIGITFRFRAERLEQVINDVTSQLSRKSEYLRVLNEIRRESTVPFPWSRDAFDYALDEWENGLSEISSSLAGTVARIGIDDFGEIFLSKGVELGVLVESTEDVEGELFAFYDLAKPTAATASA